MLESERSSAKAEDIKACHLGVWMNKGMVPTNKVIVPVGQSYCSKTSRGQSTCLESFNCA